MMLKKNSLKIEQSNDLFPLTQFPFYQRCSKITPLALHQIGQLGGLKAVQESSFFPFEIITLSRTLCN